MIPLLAQMDYQQKSRGFLLFFSFSFIAYLVLLYWIPRVMVQYGGASQFLGIIALIALSGFLSIFTGIAGLIIKKALHCPRISILLVPSIWISKDLLTEKILGGFPWCSAGYAQYRNIYFIQVAEWGGIHLVSFLVITANLLLFYLLFKHRKWSAFALLVSAGLIYGLGYYLYHGEKLISAEKPFHRAGIIQPDSRHDQVGNTHVKFDELLKKSKRLAEMGAEFVIWPEYTVPVYPMQNRFYLDKIRTFVADNVPLFAGFTDYQASNEIYNSLFLFQKESISKYDKVHLVPFGEYVLFRDLLFFVKKITDEVGDFTAGKGVVNLSLTGNKISTPICYEIIFPELIRKFIRLGGELIVTCSNDSWYGLSSAPYQLLSMAVFRSIENRRTNLRSTSNGISAVINSLGVIERRIPLNTKARFITQFSYLNHLTFFTRWGFLFPYLCTALTLIFCVRLILLARNKRKDR